MPRSPSIMAPDPFTLHTLNGPNNGPRRGVKAKGYYSGEPSEGKGEGKFVVMEDSLVYKEYTTGNTHSYAKTHKDLREKLLKEGFLHENDEKTWRMVKERKFNSASQAASIILGRNADDKEWKNEHVPVPRLLDPLQQFEDQVRGLPRETEAEQLVVQRKGQNILRDRLLRNWQCCPLTGIDDKNLLRASHIKPWAKCDDDRTRLDPNNCLLLSALWDAAFDQGLVTFYDTGKPEFSCCLSKAAKDELRWKKPIPFTPKHKEYMKYHRQHVFKKDL